MLNLSLQNSSKVFDWVQIRRHTWPLNHFHPVLLQKSNSGLRCGGIHVGKVHDDQEHGVMEASSLSV